MSVFDKNAAATHPDFPRSATVSGVPDKVGVEGLEDRWDRAWDNERTYSFDPHTTREQVYSIDTPHQQFLGPSTSATYSPTRTPMSLPATSG